jgi:molybdate transport system regulatory protein
MSKRWTGPEYDRLSMAAGWRLSARFRAVRGDLIGVGPGKVDLLEAIADTGSIRDAAESVGMSYMRAWKLIREMNAAFREPVVESSRGGNDRGGAKVTTFGRNVITLYRGMEKKALAASRSEWAELKRLLR